MKTKPETVASAPTAEPNTADATAPHVGDPSSSPATTDRSAPTPPAKSDERYATTTPPASTASEPPTFEPKPLNPPADGDRYANTPKSIEPSQPATPIGSDPVTTPKTEDKPAIADRHTDATPASATIDVKPAAPKLNVRRTAWLLGDRLSFAALAHDRGLAANDIPKWFDQAQTAARLLGTSIDGLPEAPSSADNAPVSQQVINYLIAQGRHVGGEIAQKHDRESAALFEVALKSNILLLLYAPNSPATNNIAAAISRAAPQGRLPRELWSPLLETINKQASLDEVRTAIRKMHADVDQYLASEQKSK